MAGGLKEDTSGAVNTEYWSEAHQNQWLPTSQVPQTWSFWGLYPHMFLMSDGRLFYSGGHVFGDGLPAWGLDLRLEDRRRSPTSPGCETRTCATNPRPCSCHPPRTKR